MEKIRAFLAVLSKYHFWILCVLIVLLSFVSWFLATSDEDGRFLTRKAEIEKQLGLVGKIAGNADHPSAKSIQVIHDRESGTLTNQVKNAWTHLYREQRDANPLPQVFPRPDDQEVFKAEFEKIWKPMEEIAALPPGTLGDAYRTRYQNHIQDHFPKLFGLIERRTVVENPTGEPGQPGQMTGIVDWVDADQKIKMFVDRFSGTTPNTLDIAMAQEDLWVYETLLKVIHNTNDFGKDPKHDPKDYRKPLSHKSARIKKIEAMDIGKDAVESWSKCDKALFTMPDESSSSSASSSGRGGASGPVAAALVGRYVDDKGKPVLNPLQPPFKEFRMMPIDLKVVIEQKDIPRLLAECANSAMRIDVRAVRILGQEPAQVDLGDLDSATDEMVASTTPGAGPTAQTAGAASPVSSRRPSRSARGRKTKGGMGGLGTGSDIGSGSGTAVYTEESADPVYPPVPVEVQGIIYIYNPPQNQNPGATAGSKTAANPGEPINAAAGPGAAAPTAPTTTANPAQGPAATVPATNRDSTNPRPSTPAPGGRP